MKRCVNSPYTRTLKYGATTAPYSKTNPHKGVDYVSSDKYIVAPEAGTITFYGVNGKSGNMMVLQGKYRHSFSHIKYNGNIVGVGSKVRAGQKIAVMGSTGFATGVHVHWVVNGGTINPESLIEEEDMTSRTTAIWLNRTLNHKHNPSDASIKAWTGLDDKQLSARLEKVYNSDWFKNQTKAINSSETGKVEAIWTKVKGAFGK